MLYVLALAAALFFPFAGTDTDIVWTYSERFLHIGYSPVHEIALDVIVNVGVFVPVGLLVHGVWRGSRPAQRRFAVGSLLVAFALSATVETLQGALTTWREASVRDVLSNTAGAFIGIVIERLRRSVDGAR